MHVRPGSSSGGPNFCDGIAAGYPVTNLDEVLIIVCIQHLTAIFGLNYDRISIAVFGTTLDDASICNRLDRGPFRGRDVGSGMVTHLPVDRVMPPALRRSDHPGNRK